MLESSKRRCRTEVQSNVRAQIRLEGKNTTRLKVALFICRQARFVSLSRWTFAIIKRLSGNKADKRPVPWPFVPFEITLDTLWFR